jgi:penicillin G amidase
LVAEPQNLAREGVMKGRIVFICLFVIGWYFSYMVEAKADNIGPIEIVRDQWGVAHIFAETDAGAMYGAGYAHAEDRAFQMYFKVRLIQGRAAEILGDIKKANGTQTALQNDKRMRTLGYYRAAQKAAGLLEPESRVLLEAYSRGVNDYIRQNRGKLLYLFRKLGLEPEPWTPADCIASWWHVSQFFSGDGLGDLAAYHSIKEPGSGNAGGRGGGRQPDGSIVDDSAAVVQRADVSEEWIRRVQEFADRHGVKPVVTRAAEPPKFSHGWVVGGRRTTTGASVLVSDPQVPVFNPSLLYEFHIKGKTFDARGVGVSGSPMFLIGFNEQVAWGLTALGADQADLFLLKTDPNRPDHYFFEGQWLKMDVRKETILVKKGRPEELIVRETRFGPVVTAFASGVRPGEEVSVKMVPLSDTNRQTFRAGMGMIRARGVREVLQAVADWEFPTANMVIGDRAGDIGYTVVGALPIRSAEALSWGAAAHDGSSAKADWQAILPAELAPQVVNPAPGYLLSANHRAVASFYPIPFGGGVGDTTRSRRIRELLEMKSRFTPQDVLNVHYDTVNAAKRDVVRLGYHLRDTLKVSLAPDTLKALAYLEDWFEKGARSELSVTGTELVLKMSVMFRDATVEAAKIYGGGDPGLSTFLRTVQTRIAARPDAPLTGAERAFIESSLANAWQVCRRDYGEDTSQWPRLAREEQTQRKMPYFASLDGFPSLDPAKDLLTPSLITVDGGTVLSQSGQGYTQFVPLHDTDAALSILPVGNSEHPDSPFHKVNYETWAKGQLHPAPLSRAAVLKHRTSTTELRPEKEAGATISRR